MNNRPSEKTADQLTAFEFGGAEMPLSDERLGDLLAGGANHEGKAALLLAMKPDEMYTGAELYRLLHDRVGDEPSPLKKGNQLAWCRLSLEPIGIVAKAEHGRPIRYGLTEEGERLGKPLAGLMLSKGSQFDVPLVHMWGVSQSRSRVRSPYSRYKLISTMLQLDGDIKATDLAALSGLGQTLTEMQLASMQRSGLVEYNEWNHGAQDVSYKFLKPDYEPRNWQINTVTKDALAYLRANGGATLTELTQHSADIQGQEVNPQLRAKLSGVLHDLERAGVVASQGRHDEESPVRLTEAQQEFWSGLISGIERIKKLEPAALEEYREVGKAFLQDPGELLKALKRSHESTPRGAASQGNGLGPVILRLLQQQENLSTRDLAELVAKERGKISMQGVRSVLKQLVKTEQVTESTDKVVRFSLTSRD